MRTAKSEFRSVRLSLAALAVCMAGGGCALTEQGGLPSAVLTPPPPATTSVFVEPTATLSEITLPAPTSIHSLTPTNVDEIDPRSLLAPGEYLLVAQYSSTSVELVYYSLKEHTSTKAMSLPGTPDELDASSDGRVVVFSDKAGLGAIDMASAETFRIPTNGNCRDIGWRAIHEAVTASCELEGKDGIYAFNHISSVAMLLVPQPGYEESLAKTTWSADGSQLLAVRFVHNQPVSPNPELWLVSGDCPTSCVTSVLHTLGEGDVLSDLAWSYGTKFAFGLNRTGREYPIVVIGDSMSVDAPREYPLMLDVPVFYLHDLAWSPGGLEIAMTFDAQVLYSLDLTDGSGEELLRSEEGKELQLLAWFAIE